MELSPIVTQPQYHSTTRSFEWQSDLCDCGDDCNILAKDMDECCSCGPTVAMRTRYRSLYRIPGSICLDCLTVTFCGILKMNPHTVINQPQMTVTQHQSREWQTDLFDCFNDWGVCVCGMCCPLCLGCQIASEMDECPLCGISTAFRTLYRTRYGIPGSLLIFANSRETSTNEKTGGSSKKPKVVTQPQVAAAQPKTNNWQTDLCDCFSDCGVCLCGMFCFPCLSCQVATAMNECCCCGASVAISRQMSCFMLDPGSICGDTCIVGCFPGLYGMFCFQCLAMQVAANMNECCCCGATVAMRAVYRTKYNIPGSICEDTFIVGCCPTLSLCQIQRDINRRKQMGIF
ncbi:Placenta-specific gene 8 protein, partial [Ophiophagus hannah]